MAGDFNGDGYDDLIVGAEATGPNNTGGVWIWVGGPTGLHPTPAGFVAGTEGDGGREGTILSWAGDVNGDGFDDAFVSAMEAAAQGRVVLLFGIASPGLTSDGALEFADPDQIYTEFGYAIASLERDSHSLVALAGPSQRWRIPSLLQ
jgi:hypothetical protein